MVSNRIFPAFLLYFLLSYHTGFGINVTNSLRYRLDSALLRNKVNVVVSPLAVHFGLCKLASAADGATRAVLLAALGYKNTEMVKSCFSTAQESFGELKRIDFIMFNKVFVNYTEHINSEFFRSKVNYGAEVEPVGFYNPNIAVRFINSMLDRSTLKRIPNIIEDNEINNETSILLISAVYFKVTLEHPFDVNRTKRMWFREENGTRTAVRMMTKTDSFRYLHEPETNVQFVNMRLASYGVSITFGVPRRSLSLSVLLNILHADPYFLENVHKAMSVTELKLQIPRFKIKSKLDLTDYVKTIGLHSLFNRTHSGLPGILRKNATEKPMHLTKVKQNCFIEVDELGVFRGSRDNEVSPRRFEEGGIVVTADRPFYFSINLHEDPQHLYYMRTIMSGVYRGLSDSWITIK